MLAEVSSLLVEAVSAAMTLMSEAKHRKSSTAAATIVTTLPTLDFDSALAEATDARLAAMMRGAVTKDHLIRVVRDDQIQRLMSELIVVSLVEARSSAVDEVSELVVSRACDLLDGTAAEVDVAFLARRLTELAVEFCRNLVEAASEVSVDVALGIQQLATLRRTQSILERVSDQVNSARRTYSSELKSARKRFLSEYRAVCAEVHGSIKPPDFDTNQRIPIEDLYVPARLARASDPDKHDWVNPQVLMRRVDRTVLLGDPGGGKSTLANYLTLLWARDSAGPLPFHVTLRDYAQDKGPRSILEFIESQLPVRYQLGIVDGAIEDCLAAGNAVVVFDGLDELTDPTKRRAITSAVETFAFRYPLVRVLVTSRRVGYEQAQLDPAIFESFVLDGFSSDDVAAYVEKWFASQSDYSEVESQRLSSQFMSQTHAVEELSSNPLMLSLMCIIFRGENFIPRNRPAIYEKCANLLFEKWDGHRQIEVPLLARDYVDAAMKHLAYLFLSRAAGDSGITRSQLVREMVSYLYPRAMETESVAERAADEFVSFCAGRAWVFSDAGTTAEGEEIFTFTHRTFMEYFAAVHLIRISDTPEKLAQLLLPRVSKEEWDVVAQLAVQQADRSHDRGTERALRTMLRDTRRKAKVSRARVLDFVVRCGDFAVVSPAFLQELSEVCLRFYLRNFSPDDRGPGDSLRTILGLHDHIPEAQTPIVVSVQREIIAECLSRSGHPDHDNALSYLLLGLVRRFNGRIWREDKRSEHWNEMFHELAQHLDSHLREQANAHDGIWQILLVGGVVEPSVVLSELRRHGLTFAETYLRTVVVRGFDVSGSPLAGMIVSALMHDRREHLDNKIIDFVVSSFLSDFWSGDRSREATPLEAGSFFYPGSVFERLGDLTDLDETNLDFVVLATLSLAEITPDSHRSGVRALMPDLESTKDLPLSPRARKFAVDWADGEAAVFGSVESSTPS